MAVVVKLVAIIKIERFRALNWHERKAESRKAALRHAIFDCQDISWLRFVLCPSVGNLVFCDWTHGRNRVIGCGPIDARVKRKHEVSYLRGSMGILIASVWCVTETSSRGTRIWMHNPKKGSYKPFQSVQCFVMNKINYDKESSRIHSVYDGKSWYITALRKAVRFSGRTSTIIE